MLGYLCFTEARQAIHKPANEGQYFYRENNVFESTFV